MELMIDTFNKLEIQQLLQIVPISGITTNPSIIKKEGNIDFFENMNAIRKIIGENRSLHIQLVATSFSGMLNDVETILTRVDNQVYIKVPTTEVGLAVIRKLKTLNVNVTATAIYTRSQALMAILCGADYIAPYFNRMENLDIDPAKTIKELVKFIKENDMKTKLLAASFKNTNQVDTAVFTGCQAVTVSPNLLYKMMNCDATSQAILDFSNDWVDAHGKESTISSLDLRI